MDTAVDDGEELVISARVTEELCVDCERTPPTTAARSTERVLSVEVAVPCERHATALRADRVIASVSRPLKHQHPRSSRSRIPAAAAAAGGGGDVTREVEHGVEAGVAAL